MTAYAPDAHPHDRILSIGMLQPRYTLEETLETVSSTGAQAAADLLFKHKIGSLALAAAREHADSVAPDHRALLGELTEHIAQRVSVMADLWREAPDVAAQVGECAHEDGVAWWTMKGFSLRELYPQSGLRDVGDLDIFLATVDDAWVLIRRLRALGYVYQESELPWFKQDIGTGRLYGQMRLTTPHGDQLPIDIHAGYYSVRHCGVMRLQRTEERPGTPGGPIALEDDVCGIVVNAAGDCFITTKMINDLVLALAHELDTEYIGRTLDHAGLLPFLATCLGRIGDWCRLTEAQRARLAQLMPDVAAEPVPPEWAPDPEQRCEITVSHARDIAARLYPADPAQVEAITASARDAYGKDHPLMLVPDDEAAAPALPELNNWTCVRMVPQPLAVAQLQDTANRTAQLAAGPRRSLSGELAVEATDAGELVHVIGESFVPTTDFALSRRFVEALSGR